MIFNAVEYPFASPRADDTWTDGSVRCVGIALIDEDGRAVETLYHGQSIRVAVQFEVLSDIGLPTGWFELHDSAGQLVHGRNTFQVDSPSPGAAPVGSHIQFECELHMDVSPGRYVLSVGLSSTAAEVVSAYRFGPRDMDMWPSGSTTDRHRWGTYREGAGTEEWFRSQLTEHARVIYKEELLVGFDEAGRLPHSGVADLRSQPSIQVTFPGDGSPNPDHVGPESLESRTTLVHITHAKAGSQWIHQILQRCLPDKIAKPTMGSGHFAYTLPQLGWVYPTVYLTRDRFDLVPLPEGTRTFVVIRDLRDTLVSGYFSMLATHREIDRSVTDLRHIVSQLQKEAALLYLMDGWLSQPARIQITWLESGERLHHYEKLVEHDLDMFEQLLIVDAGMPISRETLRSAVLASRFEQVTGGRVRGVEDRTAHERLGIAGDWKNHFTDRVKRAFKARYGGLLVATGYERNLDW